jgi:hypothetical protein
MHAGSRAELHDGISRLCCDVLTLKMWGVPAGLPVIVAHFIIGLFV